jgi:hypothetical protein
VKKVASNPLYRPATEIFGARGYKKQAGLAVFTRPMPSGLVARVAMNATTGGGLTLNPLLGVNYPELERWVDRLLERPASTLQRPSADTTLGLLIPRDQRVRWDVSKDKDEQNAETWDLIGQQFDEFGVPWLMDRGTPEKLVGAVQRFEAGSMNRCDLPVLLWLLGQEAAAREALDVERRRPFTGGTVIDYEGFADRLLVEIDSHPAGPATWANSEGM